MIELASNLEELRPRITVIGVGGAGGNTVANMIRSGVQGVDFVVANTDAQALRTSPAERVLQLGRHTTEGLGAGSRAEVGRLAAEESLAEIDAMLDGAHMCFIAAGLGGGTGTGAAPVIARVAREKGILTVAVVTKPFAFEGRRRARAAEEGLDALHAHVDTMIVIPNQNLFRLASPDTPFKAAFDLADEVLQQGVRGITDLMLMPGYINLDFADVRTIMAGMGKAMMGTGEATGDNRAIEAAELAISNPLVDEAVKGARGLIISISGGEDMRLLEVDEAANYIKNLVDPEADIIWGSAFNPDLEGILRVSIVATGIDANSAPTAMPATNSLSKAAQVLAARLAPAPAPAPELVDAEVAATPAIPRLETLIAPALSIDAATLVLETIVEAAGSTDTAIAEEMSDEELLLTTERVLTLVPPTPPEAARPVAGAISIRLPEDYRARDPFQMADPIRGASLFERMADAARGAVARARENDVPPLAHLNRRAVYLDRRSAA